MDEADYCRLSLKEFLITEQCPTAWQCFDLYIFRDEHVVFYVGQSHLAFDRIWQHIGGGFKGRSVVGQFILRNWPISAKFSIELLNSRSSRFACVGNNLDAAESHLIEQLAPCFNATMNAHPTPLPDCYLPPLGGITRPWSIKRMILEASFAVKAERRQKLLDEL